MEENLLKKWLEENNFNTEDLPKTRAEAVSLMRESYSPIDALNIAELEPYAENGDNKAYVALYANCLLNARKTGNYVEVNRLRHLIGMEPLQ